MSIAAYQNSQDLQVLSASPLELVCMLYQGAIDTIDQAIVYLKRGEIRERSAKITKACAIVSELMLSINRAAGDKVADNLIELYAYMHRRLLEANVEQAEAPLIEVRKLLSTLLEAWRQIEQTASTPIATPKPRRPSYDGEYESVSSLDFRG